jgi:hypothetical protein
MSCSPRYLFVDPNDIIAHNPSFCKNVPRTTIALIPLGSSNARSIKKGQIFHENLPPKRQYPQNFKAAARRRAQAASHASKKKNAPQGCVFLFG